MSSVAAGDVLLERLGVELPVVQAGMGALYAGETALRIDSIVTAREAVALLSGTSARRHSR